MVTDGTIWKVWDLGEIGGKELVGLDIQNKPLGEAARKLLALWRPAAGKIEVAPAPIVKPPPPPGITLAELKAKVKPHDQPPRSIQFPDGQQEALKHWKDLLVAVAGSVEPKLRANQLPVKLGKKRFLLSSKPVHSDGQPFRAPAQVGKLWLETHFSAEDCVRHACRLLEVVGVSPDQVRVES